VDPTDLTSSMNDSDDRANEIRDLERRVELGEIARSELERQIERLVVSNEVLATDVDILTTELETERAVTRVLKVATQVLEQALITRSYVEPTNAAFVSRFATTGLVALRRRLRKVRRFAIEKTNAKDEFPRLIETLDSVCDRLPAEPARIGVVLTRSSTQGDSAGSLPSSELAPFGYQVQIAVRRRLRRIRKILLMRSLATRTSPVIRVIDSISVLLPRAGAASDSTQLDEALRALEMASASLRELHLPAPDDDAERDLLADDAVAVLHDLERGLANANASRHAKRRR